MLYKILKFKKAKVCSYLSLCLSPYWALYLLGHVLVHLETGLQFFKVTSKLSSLGMSRQAYATNLTRCKLMPVAFTREDYVVWKTCLCLWGPFSPEKMSDMYTRKYIQRGCHIQVREVQEGLSVAETSEAQLLRWMHWQEALDRISQNVVPVPLVAVW